MKKHFRLLLPDEGQDLYTPYDGQNWGYRYGPSLMAHDGVVDGWFASPGAQGEADWFTYRRSTDGGATWSPEKAVLKPTADSMDWFSVCDPAVIRYGGYYYIAYTSTIFAAAGGVCNNAFVARSRRPDGPFEKWTGTGWGETRGNCHWTGFPAPILYYDEDWKCWGAGEPSMVVKDDILYFYYTWTSHHDDGSLYHMTRVATADITREDWPVTLTPRGCAIDRTGIANDSFDVVYCEDLDKFVAIATDRRFTKDSMLVLYESDDGLRFRRVNELRTNTSWMCHNSGISGDALHHIRTGDTMLLAYAYGNQWGKWGTRLHRYAFTGMEEDFYSEAALPAVERPIPAPARPAPWTVAMTAVPPFYRMRVGEEIPVCLHWLDTCYTETPVTGDVTFDNYDSHILRQTGTMTFRAEKEGYTFVNAHWHGECVEFLVRVYPADFDLHPACKTVVSFQPMQTEYIIRTDRHEAKQVRGMARYSDGTWFEVIDEIDCIELKGKKSAGIAIDDHGILTASRPGAEAYVTLTYGGHSFTVHVRSLETDE